MDLFSKSCPNCGHNNPNQAVFCANCGTALSGGKIICGNCGTENRGDANYCKKCGQALASHAAAGIRGQSWARGEGDFAVRIEADDLPALLRRGITIQPGTNAMLVEAGANRGELGPGTYTLDSPLLNWVTGSTKKTSVLLVDVLPAELEFNLGGAFTKDPIRIGLTVHVQAQVEQPARFLVQMLATRERYSREDLRQYLYPEVTQVVVNWIGRHTVKELAEDMSLKDKLELALDEALKPTLSRLGLKFIAVRTLNMNMEHLDRIKGIRSNYALQITEAEAEAEGKNRLVDATRELNLQKIIEETAKVEDEEKRADLYQRMRQAVMAGKMDEVRTEAEFQAFLDDTDRAKLLREKERAELLRNWKEDAEDQQRARARLIAKTEVEQKYELAAADLSLRQDLGKKDLEFELEMERKRAEQEYSVRALEWEYALKKEDAEIEIRRKRHDGELAEDKGDLEIAFEAMRQMKAIKGEEKEHDLKLQLDEQRVKNEMEIQRLRMQHEFEMQRMERLTTMSAEAIISISGPEQGRILADLKKTEALKGMSEDQILTMMAEHSPEVAHALEEKFRSIASGKASAREQEMYEKLLAERETTPLEHKLEAGHEYELEGIAEGSRVARLEQTSLSKLAAAYPKFTISVAHPKLLSKRLEAPFVIQLHIKEMESDANAKIKAIIGKDAHEHKYATQLRRGNVVRIGLYSPYIEFPKPKIKTLDLSTNVTKFLARPMDNCFPGDHNVELSIVDDNTGAELQSEIFKVRVIDFAFDHVPRPLLSNVSTAILSVGTFAIFVLTFLEQIDKTLGLTAGTAAGILAAVIYAYFYDSYRRIRLNIPN